MYLFIYFLTIRNPKKVGLFGYRQTLNAKASFAEVPANMPILVRTFACHAGGKGPEKKKKKTKARDAEGTTLLAIWGCLPSGPAPSVEAP